jgi:vacuolar-type H+-ATPase subunit H
MQMKDAELNNSEHHIQELQATHQQELAEVDKRWRQCLEQQLMEAESRHKEELAELSKEWHWERKVKNMCTHTDIFSEYISDLALCYLQTRKVVSIFLMCPPTLPSSFPYALNTYSQIISRFKSKVTV